jgi:diguanylate cyclase (GGDEF)-like protein
MVHETKLSEVLSEFARTLATDFPIQAILDHLVGRIVEILPVTAAGVTLITADRSPRYIAASNDAAMRFEQLQTSIGEGPCLLAYDLGEAVVVPDLHAETRFPTFTPAALAAGLAAVFTFPMRGGEGRLGALDLYRDSPRVLNAEEMGTAQTLADVAAAYLLNAEAREIAREASDHFRHSATHDPLTGLPNRVMLQQRMDHAARRAARSHTNAAILFVDLDRFKEVNDTYGHQTGDLLLLEVADRLSALVRTGDTLARYSGDEFVFLCEDMASPADAEILARRIGDAFTRRFVLGDTEVSITASVGTAYAGPGQEISSQLLADADVAMYQAKGKGGAGHQMFDVLASRTSTERATLERDLRTALLDDDLDLAYQPIVRSADGLVTGAEALLRWTRSGRGAVSPWAMVAAAEQSGLISDIGAWVLERACRDHAAWDSEHADIRLQVAVNVSARQLMGVGFCAMVADVLDRTGIDPQALVLEITENVLLLDTERAIVVLNELKDLGVHLALDDFGTGYSSLSYLHQLPIDIIKIDQSFIADLGHPAGGRVIVDGVTKLAKALHLVVIAEGVETQAQCDEIRDIGCEFAQGFHFARPMPGSLFDARLAAAPTGQLHLPAEPHPSLVAG